MNKKNLSKIGSVKNLGGTKCQNQENQNKLLNYLNLKIKSFQHQGAKFDLNI